MTLSFSQKRDRPADIEPAWVQLGKTEDGFAINQYFVDHPEMILGELTTESTQYGREELTVAPIEAPALQTSLPKRYSILRASMLKSRWKHQMLRMQKSSARRSPLTQM